MSIKILLDDQIEKLFNDNPELSIIKKNKFELAVANFINVKLLYGLEFEDLINGITGDSGDEGIDFIYLFQNGILVNSDDIDVNSSSIFKLKIFQVKKEDGFSVEGFRKIKEGIEEIFNLELDPNRLKFIGANQELIDKVVLIRTVFRKSRLAQAKFSVDVFYITSASEINIPSKINLLQTELKSKISYIPFNFEFLAAQEILDLTTKSDETIEVIFNGQPIMISEKGSDTKGYAGFVEASMLISPMLDDLNNFRSDFTDGNIRFFLGEDKKINSSIIESALSEDKSKNFWAMNNGITILASELVPLAANSIAVTNPQIINGCQTIHCLYLAYKNNSNTLSSSIKVFTKLVKSSDIETQSDIISATNSQNPVKSASLKANDNIQRNIETLLRNDNIYYERRENFYKKQCYSGIRVIGLLRMAQILHTVINKESVVAFNDTSTLFDTEVKYNSIFNEQADYDIYRFSCLLYLKLWSIKNSDLRSNDYASEERELILNGGFAILHLMSTLMMSHASIQKNGNIYKEKWIGKITIEIPQRKNAFSLRKKSLFELLENDVFLSDNYEISKKLLYEAADKFQLATGKPKRNVFKNRGFDRDYIRPVVEEYVNMILKENTK
jgi:hypothetical protein